MQRGRNAGRGLRAVGFEKLQPRRGVVEDIAHGDARALRAADGRHVDDIACLNDNAHALGRALFARYKLNAADRCDRRKRLAAKAHRSDGFKTLFVMQLARCVPGEGNARVLGAHAAAVVAYFYVCRAAAFELDRHLGCARVEGVFHKLLYHRRRTLDDLTGGDHIGHQRRKNINACHGLTSSLLIFVN